MVCNRCKMVVEMVLENLKLNAVNIELGEVEVSENLSKSGKQSLNKALQQYGFELIDDRKGRVIESIKTVIINNIHHGDEMNGLTFSKLLEKEIHQEYSSLSKLFSEVQGITIEKFIISQKIERIKELLVYDEFSLSQIADQLNYSSVAHLSGQFKKFTGFTPSHFKALRKERKAARIPIEEI